VWTGYANEITQRKAFETAYRQSEAKFRAFVENANDIIYNLSREGILTYVSPNWTEMLGHPTEDVIGKSFEHFVHPDDIAHCHAFLLMVFGTGKKQSGIEYQVRHKNGDWYWYRSNASPLFDDNGEVCSYIGIARDISEHKQLLDRMQHMAHHDALTGLANRSLFFDHLHQAILQAQRDKQGLAVLFLDLDKFKPINDDYGHAIGDLLLQQVAMRIKTCVRTSDVVGRIGGDEFVVLLSNVTLPDTAELVANKIRESLAVPFQLREIPAQISVSVGMAFYPEHGKQALELVRSADEAMYLAKAGNGVSQPAMQKSSGQ
uniref:diguanylate cyclase domain-containing protein n=1 Tax=Methylophaga lonarensis TaxID=999151 RepID=UPI003D286B78